MNVNKVHAVQPQVECEERKRIVYVRGSGQDYEKSEELDKLRESLELSIDEELYVLDELENTIDFLKTEPEYKSIAVFGGLSDTLNGGAAIIFQSSFGKYRQSVNSGKNLLEKYIRYYAKLGVCVIPIGYSQGAQIVGETLLEFKDEPWILSKIKYVGLLGDPKLDLYGIDIVPGKNIPWYRGNAVPLIQKGILENRSPYIPIEENKPLVTVSSWCYDDDLICTGNYAGGIINNGHSKYPSRSIPSMATEIASIISPTHVGVSSGSYPRQICGTAKQDIVILLDTSPLMRRDAKLFTDTPMYDPFHTTPQGAKLPARTAGQMLTSVGCGDTRLAVVGYGRANDGPPRLLLDFTNNAAAYDELMKSLYEPSATGTYDRTQFREGVMEALNANWREGANRAIYAFTDIAGSGPEWGNGTSGYADSLKQDRYRKDITTQQVLNEARNKRTVIWGLPVRHSYAGYAPATPVSGGDTRSYLNMFTEQTGGYNWNKEWINYGDYNFKFTRLHESLNEALQRQDRLMATVTPAQGKVGERLSIKLVDTVSLLATAKLRNDSIGYRWHVDCLDKTVAVSKISDELSFVPTTPQKCTGSVIVAVKNMTGNGCYSGCPEPYPPYMQRSFPFEIDIRPDDYIPKIPAQITHIQKTIFDDKVEYVWEAPVYNGNESLVYVVRDEDGSVLAATTTRSLTITDTQKNDPTVYIEAAGLDGRSAAASSDSANIVVDMRVSDIARIVDLPIIAPGKNIGAPSEGSSGPESSEEVLSYDKDLSYSDETENDAGSPVGPNAIASHTLGPQRALESTEPDELLIPSVSASENSATVLGDSTASAKRDSDTVVQKVSEAHGVARGEKGEFIMWVVGGLSAILVAIFIARKRSKEAH